MVQKARRENRYAGCSRIVPQKNEFEILICSVKVNWSTPVHEWQVVRKWTSNTGVFGGFGMSSPVRGYKA